VIIIVFIFLPSCATYDSIPISDTSTRLNIYGVSVLPPQQNDWTIIRHNGDQLLLRKSGEEDKSYVAVVSIHFLQDISSENEFLKLIENAREAIDETGRIIILENNIEFYKGKADYCVKFKTLMNDFGAKRPSGNTEAMLIETIGFNCRHPFNKNILVNVEYSRRYYPSYSDSSWQEEADQFLNQIKFNNINIPLITRYSEKDYMDFSRAAGDQLAPTDIFIYIDGTRPFGKLSVESIFADASAPMDLASSLVFHVFKLIELPFLNAKYSSISYKRDLVQPILDELDKYDYAEVAEHHYKNDLKAIEWLNIKSFRAKYVVYPLSDSNASKNYSYDYKMSNANAVMIITMQYNFSSDIKTLKLICNASIVPRTKDLKKFRRKISDSEIDTNNNQFEFKTLEPTDNRNSIFWKTYIVEKTIDIDTISKEGAVFYWASGNAEKIHLALESGTSDISKMILSELNE
jgi:hypothetical protein